MLSLRKRLRLGINKDTFMNNSDQNKKVVSETTFLSVRRNIPEDEIDVSLDIYHHLSVVGNDRGVVNEREEEPKMVKHTLKISKASPIAQIPWDLGLISDSTYNKLRELIPDKVSIREDYQEEPTLKFDTGFSEDGYYALMFTYMLYNRLAGVKGFEASTVRRAIKNAEIFLNYHLSYARGKGLEGEYFKFLELDIFPRMIEALDSPLPKNENELRPINAPEFDYLHEREKRKEFLSDWLESAKNYCEKLNDVDKAPSPSKIQPFKLKPRQAAELIKALKVMNLDNDVTHKQIQHWAQDSFGCKIANLGSEMEGVISRNEPASFLKSLVKEVENEKNRVG